MTREGRLHSPHSLEGGPKPICIMDTCDALSQPVLCSMGRHPLHWQFRTHFPAEGHFVKAALSKSNSATLLVMDAEFAFVHFQGTTLMHNVQYM